MGMKIVLATILFSVIGLSVSTEGFAAIYKYTDKDGMICFSDDLQSIPEQYRATAKIVSGEEKEEHKGKTNHNEQNAPSKIKKEVEISGTMPEKSVVEKNEKDIFGRRSMVSAIVVLSSIFAFVILRKLDEDHKKSIAIIRVIIIWGVSVYLLYTYAGDLIAVVRSMGTKIESSKQQAEERGKKAVKNIQLLNSLLEQVDKKSPSDTGETEQEKKKEEK